jgi:riboflavin biosynthesis pyrimidine reductase
MDTPQSRFERLVGRKTAEAEHAAIHPLVTTAEGPVARTLDGAGNRWSTRLYDGPFALVDPPARAPAISLVFVQSRDGNTVVDRPADLGGGPTDLHLIYEGLSRVAADAVMAGAGSARGTDTFFSVWHPELVALRRELGLPRHPAQIVISARGEIDVDDGLLFNVPQVPVFVLAGAACIDRRGAAFARRPWVTVAPLDADGLAGPLHQLRREHGIARISAIGGRSTAAQLIEAGLAQDLCLTTTARAGGEPGTPFHGGRPPRLELIVRKTGTDPSYPIVVEHFAIGDGAPVSARPSSSRPPPRRPTRPR